MRRCADIMFDTFSGFQQISASKFLHKVKAAPIPGPIKVFPRGSCRLRATLTLPLLASIASFHQQSDSSLLLDHHRRGTAPSNLSLQVLLACVPSSLRCWTGLRLFSPLCLCERNRTGSRLTLPCCLCTAEAGALQMTPGTSSAVFKAGGRLGGRASPCFKPSHVSHTHSHTRLHFSNVRSQLAGFPKSGRSERPPGPSVTGIQALERCVLPVDTLVPAPSNCISVLTGPRPGCPGTAEQISPTRTRPGCPTARRPAKVAQANVSCFQPASVVGCGCWCVLAREGWVNFQLG